VAYTANHSWIFPANPLHRPVCLHSQPASANGKVHGIRSQRGVGLKTARRLEMCLAVELDLNITHYVDLYLSCSSLMVFCGNPSEWGPNAPFLSIKLVRSNNAGEAELVLNCAI